MALTLPVATPQNADWRLLAACRNSDPALFFPIGTTGPAVEQIRSAKAVCGQCPARQPCLDFAMSTRPGLRRVGRYDRGRAAPAASPEPGLSPAGAGLRGPGAQLISLRPGL